MVRGTVSIRACPASAHVSQPTGDASSNRTTVDFSHRGFRLENDGASWSPNWDVARRRCGTSVGATFIRHRVTRARHVAKVGLYRLWLSPSLQTTPGTSLYSRSCGSLFAPKLTLPSHPSVFGSATLIARAQRPLLERTSPFLPWDGMAFRLTISPARMECVSQDHASRFSARSQSQVASRRPPTSMRMP
jgi:hypothetical protein